MNLMAKLTVKIQLTVRAPSLAHYLLIQRPDYVENSRKSTRI